MQSITFVTFTVSEKIATLKFLPHNYGQSAGQPNTENYMDSHFSCEAKKYRGEVRDSF